eukprot:CAMPEP_0179441522 /NCGR_PEP_ID=MMETSP0799-20121207/25058_1 /TAXON_ID=46947 /ORGANISM="Geminigera cryophila, Strain CCMP2564" /LENGTH=251 /DNA_ID=CAMNT_0021225829 /DNA_START=17 /DNA_END=769 /DNA_ORIENTATION=-
MPSSSFEEIRGVTGWVRPGGGHGCKPVQIIPGLWTAHYHDVDTQEKLAKTAPNVSLVVNTAPRQCEARTGTLGPGIQVMLVNLEDDPDERKLFDCGKPATYDASTSLFKCAGDAKKDFEPVAAAIQKTLAGGGEVLVHCHASISRSAVFIIAYLMKHWKMSAVDATRAVKSKWSACWPCDRFTMQLLEYEKELHAPVIQCGMGKFAAFLTFAAAAGALSVSFSMDLPVKLQGTPSLVLCLVLLSTRVAITR